ncbi:TetR/AcrR family transcriptional regulator [Leucobacter sp. HY1910]
MTERRARRKPGENRERLLQAGLHEFGLYGYQGASTARISARADVPQPHVYANFSGKPALFLECLDRACNVLADAASESRERTAGQLFIFQAIAASHDPDHGSEILARLDRAGLLTQARRDNIVVAAAAYLVGEADS